MDEEFGSFIVTDPDIVDEGIDVSGLRTKTDTSLLGNIPELAGVQYEAFNPNRLSDLMRFYQTGLPTRSVSQPTTPPATGGGESGGGGQATTPITTPITTPVTTPTTTATTTTPFIETSPNVLSATDPVTGQPTSGNIIDPKTGDVFAPGDYSDVAGTLADPREKIDFTPEQQGTIQNILGQAGQTVESALTQLGKIPGAVVDAANQTVDLFGKKINIGKTLAAAAINKIAGGPVSLVFEAAKALAPERDPRQNALDELYDVKDGTIQSGLMKGYNPVSGGFPGVSEPTFGLQDAYDKRIDTIENTLKDKYNMSDAEIADVKAGSYKGDVDTNLLDTLVDLEDAKAREKDVLDAAETGAPQENIGATDTIASLQDKERLDQQRLASLTGDVDFGTTPTRNITTDITSDQIDEFGIAPATSVTRPGTVLGKPGIERFDDAEASIDMFEDTAPITTGGPPSVMSRGLNQAGRAATQIGGQTALMRSGARGLYSPVDIMKTGTTPERAAKILEEGFRGGTVPTYAGKGKAFVGDPNVAKMYGDEILDVVTPAGGIRTIGGGIGKKGLAIGEEVALDPKTATKGLSLAQRLEAGAYPSSPTAQRLLQTGTTAARPIAKFAGRALPGVGAVLAAEDAIARAQEGDYIGSALGAASALPLVGIPFLGAQAALDLARSDIGTDVVPGEGFDYLDDIDISQDAPTAPIATDRIGTFDADTFDDDVSLDDFDTTPLAPPTPTVPDFISGGRDRDPAPSAPSSPSGPPESVRRGGGADSTPSPSPAPRDTGSDYGQFDRAVDRSTPDYSGVTTGGPPSRGGRAGGPPSQGGGGGGGGGCFLKGTQVTMADGSTKAIEQVDLGDDVAEGGKVFATGKFLVENLHDYKGIKVSGSHMVSEEGNWVRVEDSKYGKPLGDEEHTVYVFGSENRRILINDILFTDYFEVTDQEKLLKYENKFFDNWRSYSKNEDINNVNTLNAS